MDLNIRTQADVPSPGTSGNVTPPRGPAEDVEPGTPGTGTPTPAPTTGGGAGGTEPATSDDLYAKILKYIPAPLIGVYLFAQNLVFSADDPSEGLAWAIFLLFAVLVALYLVFRKVRRAVQIGLSVLAFVAWAAASPGPFHLMDDWDPMYASLALAIVAAILITVPLQPLPPEE